MTTTQDLAATLTHDGDTVDLEGGDTLRLVFRPDDSNPFEEADSYGRVEWARRSRRNQQQRPSGFDGNAEKLYVGGDAFWWQPPADVKRTGPGFDALRTTVRDLAEFGYIGVVVERLSGQDAYQRPIVVNVASLWGIEPDPDPEYLQTVVADLIAEVI